MSGSTEMSSAHAALNATTVDASNVLLSVPSSDDFAGTGCRDLVSIAPPAQSAVLRVTFDAEAPGPIDRRNPRLGERPARTAIVYVGETKRSVASAQTPATDEAVRYECVENPADLTSLGITISGILEEWANAGLEIVVCFDSLTELLEHVEQANALRFLHVTTGQVRAVDGLAHYHLDPTAHDEQTVGALKSLVEAVIERDGDRWSVTAR